jgi:2-oxoglutarate ferredoxin oxidoreductase subunit alpha
LRALPVNDTVKQFVADHKKLYIFEMNRDGQLHQILTLEAPLAANKLFSSTLNNGLSLTAEWIRDDILAKEQN